MLRCSLPSAISRSDQTHQAQGPPNGERGRFRDHVRVDRIEFVAIFPAQNIVVAPVGSCSRRKANIGVSLSKQSRQI